MGIFNWFRGGEDVKNPTKVKRRSPATVNETESMQVNYALTHGLYHNSYPGMKLGGALAYNPIAVPVSLMGFPIPRVEDNDNIQDALDSLVASKTDELKDIHTQCHREGTIWIYPKFSNGDVVWEFIRDDTVSDIIKDLESGEVIRLETSEDILLSIGNGKTATVTRNRIYTRDRVVVKFSGQIPAGLTGSESRNPAGIIPIAFANNSDGSEVRGHSDYERILSDLKSYHDIDLAEQNILAKFTPKMIQKVKDVEKWAQNNGYDDANDMFTNVEVNKIDLIMNLSDEETTFEFPDKATESYRDAKKQRFHKIIEGSGIPEIAWGLKTEGNMASVEENMSTLMNLVSDKQDQKTAAYKILFSASLSLLNQAFVVDDTPEMDIAWNKLDGLSDKTKSEIFKNFADGVSKLTGIAGWTEQQLFNFWKKNFPQITEEEFEEFKTGLRGMAGHVVTTGASVDELMISNGGDI